MQPFPTEDNNVIDSQAVPEDYKGSPYTKLHLAPFSHLHAKDDGMSTFTLTNIVPQRKGSINNRWRNLEKEMTELKQFCQGNMYVITGVIPGKRWLKTKVDGENRVNIPDYLWSVYCCPDPTPNLPEVKKSLFPTHAAMGSNMDKSDQVEDFVVTHMSLQLLEKILRRELDFENLSLFYGLCKTYNEKT